MSLLACHMWSFGRVLASGAAWGSFRAMAFQSPYYHLLDQRPCLFSLADVAAAGTAEVRDCPTPWCLPRLHAYGFRDCYRSLITCGSWHATNKHSAMWTVLLNAICAQGGVYVLIFFSSYGYISFDTLCEAVLISDISWCFLESCWSGIAQPSSPAHLKAAQLSMTGF